LTEQAIEELLRYAGLARTLTRTATADIDLNGSFIRRGERIILRILAANRDPERFSQPHHVDVTRSDGGHFTLGAGPISANLRIAFFAFAGARPERLQSLSIE
jgi:cytochrome P450